MTNWIKLFIKNSDENRWCHRCNCTTCGALIFRSILLKTAIKYSEVSLDSSDIRKRYGYIILGGILSRDKQKRIIATICEELYALSNDDIAQIRPKGLHLIFTEIYENSSREFIKDILKDSPAGDYLKRMEEYERVRSQARLKAEDPTLSAERKRIKTELKAKAHIERVKKYKNIYYGKKINPLTRKPHS